MTTDMPWRGSRHVRLLAAFWRSGGITSARRYGAYLAVLLAAGTSLTGCQAPRVPRVAYQPVRERVNDIAPVIFRQHAVDDPDGAAEQRQVLAKKSGMVSTCPMPMKRSRVLTTQAMTSENVENGVRLTRPSLTRSDSGLVSGRLRLGGAGGMCP